MERRPKLKIPKTTSEKLANIIGYSIFIGALMYLAVVYTFLPERIPMQYGMDGEVNRFGSPVELLFLVALPILLLPLMEWLERVPEIHNYPERINDSNRRAFYLNSRKLLNFTKNGMSIVFAIVFIEITNYHVDNSSTFGPFLIPLTLIPIFVPLVWGLLQRRKIK